MGVISIGSEYVAYEAKMCYFNDLQLFVPFRMIHTAKEHEMHLQLEALMSIKALVSVEGHVSEQLFITLLESLREAVGCCENYLLDCCHISLSLDNTFYDGEQFRFVYVPESVDTVIEEMLVSYFEQLYPLLDQNSTLIHEKLHQIRMALSEETFDLDRFQGEILPAGGTFHG